jgi:hypothetical protein
VVYLETELPVVPQPKDKAKAFVALATGIRFVSDREQEYSREVQTDAKSRKSMAVRDV